MAGNQSGDERQEAHAIRRSSADDLSSSDRPATGEKERQQEAGKNTNPTAFDGARNAPSPFKRCSGEHERLRG